MSAILSAWLNGVAAARMALTPSRGLKDSGPAQGTGLAPTRGYSSQRLAVSLVSLSADLMPISIKCLLVGSATQAVYDSDV